MNHQQSINKFTSGDRWFSAIGRFIFEFSQLEYTLKNYVAEATGLRDQHFNSIMSHDFSRLCAVAETVLLQTGADPAFSLEGDWGDPPAYNQRLMAEYDADKLQRSKTLKDLIKQCRSLNDDRIRVVHGLWMIAGGTGALDYVSRQTFENCSYFREPDELAKKADQAANLRNEISRWV